MPYDKLSLVNTELAETGNALVAVADDGSDEWTVCSAAYDAAVDLTLERHDWNFGTQIVTLQRTGTSPDDVYSDAYARPTGALSIVWVRLQSAGIDQPCDYKIIDGQIVLNSNNLTPICKIVVDPGVSNWPPVFCKIVRQWVRAAIYRGLQEDPRQADVEEGKAERALMEARTRVDQDAPKRAMFNSRVRAARRVRRPWISTPAGWSGTDVPS